MHSSSRWNFLRLLQSRLLPYLVTAVGDMVPAVHTAALQIVEALGIQYEKEHHDEVIERKQYGVDGDRRVDRQRVYPAPFTGRPRLGSRLYVRTSAPRFVKVVLRELSASGRTCSSKQGGGGNGGSGLLICLVDTFPAQVHGRPAQRSMQHASLSC